MATKKKDRLIKKEIKRLTDLFKDLEENKKSAVEGLIQEAAFMRVTLSELKEDINTNGPIDEMEQGEYSILRASPSVTTYNTMIQRYTTVMKEILNLFPKKDAPTVEDDGFESFVTNRD
ncbi:hypothetical protein [Cytobacillus praedii]|uniref:P27 family phage terminase small subunit n=1 Tax=Cytobacillus praedii TaxID=1742358 RepID=A0A4R1ANX7_9BACI|nr:hypothetical protein [Cytobacillus praedii]TCJ01586.1 hypothetical protein E0Y62_23425 [Cytobacillus praedii]